jgi:hypothetical protein
MTVSGIPDPASALPPERERPLSVLRFPPKGPQSLRPSRFGGRMDVPRRNELSERDWRSRRVDQDESRRAADQMNIEVDDDVIPITWNGNGLGVCARKCA